MADHSESKSQSPCAMHVYLNKCKRRCRKTFVHSIFHAVEHRNQRQPWGVRVPYAHCAHLPRWQSREWPGFFPVLVPTFARVFHISHLGCFLRHCWIAPQTTIGFRSCDTGVVLAGERGGGGASLKAVWGQTNPCWLTTDHRKHFGQGKAKLMKDARHSELNWKPYNVLPENSTVAQWHCCRPQPYAVLSETPRFARTPGGAGLSQHAKIAFQSSTKMSKCKRIWYKCIMLYSGHNRITCTAACIQSKQHGNKNSLQSFRMLYQSGKTQSTRSIELVLHCTHLEHRCRDH